MHICAFRPSEFHADSFNVFGGTVHKGSKSNFGEAKEHKIIGISHAGNGGGTNPNWDATPDRVKFVKDRINIYIKKEH